jgi:hypothetical protein
MFHYQEDKLLSEFSSPLETINQSTMKEHDIYF